MVMICNLKHPLPQIIPTGFLGMLVGVILAFQLAVPDLNYIAGEYSIFGRLRPLHTNVIIYGFTLSGIWAGWYYLGQRVLKITYHDHPFLKLVATQTSKKSFASE